MNLIILNIFLHLLFFLSIFEIYFKSPIVKIDNRNQTIKFKAAAKRLVLFVGDGLRADKLFFTNQDYFLNNIAISKGLKAYSHTRIPTESRPGHIAIIAGFYEDPSAVTKGWKKNPVDFDSVFNQSRYTFSWGSPDILPIFSKGDGTDKHIKLFTYDENFQKFGENDTTIVDKWVLENFKEFLKNVDKVTLEALHSDKLILFFHLLGMDIAGHSFKPHSAQYLNGLMILNEIIEELTNLINAFYNDDNQTTFIFTSDHGMTDWGSHGSGTNEETQTPLVAWGAGIKQTLRLREINQVDIAVLMSTLLAIKIPVNSVGILPQQLINFINPIEMCHAHELNLQQILSQYNTKQSLVVKSSLVFQFKQFQLPKLEDLLQKIKKTCDKGTDGAVGRERENLDITNEIRTYIYSLLEGIHFYQNYYQTTLLFLVSVSMIGWIIISVTNTFCETVSIPHYPSPRLIFIIAVVTLIILFEKLPLVFLGFFWTPIVIWYYVVYLVKLKYPSDMDADCFTFYVLLLLFLAALSQVLVYVFFYRFLLSVVQMVLTLIIYYLYLPFSEIRTAWFRIAPHYFPVHINYWFITSLLLMVFPLLPVVSSGNRTLLIVSNIFWIVFQMTWKNIFFVSRKLKFNTLELTFLLLCLFINLETNLLSKSLIHYISWSMTIFAIFSPFFHSTKLRDRYFRIVFALAIPFLLLSSGYEPLFLLVFSINLYIWLEIEFRKKTRANKLGKTNRIKFTKKLETKDEELNYVTNFFNAFIILYYFVLAFFGTGNIASINSFDPMWVRWYLTVFSPFLMTALILFKIIVPFILTAAILRAICLVNDVKFSRALHNILFFSDLMALHFLFLVKNEGSWLDIGISISHFVIMQAISFFIMILYAFTYVYTTFEIKTHDKRPRKTKLVFKDVEDDAGIEEDSDSKEILDKDV